MSRALLVVLTNYKQTLRNLQVHYGSNETARIHKLVWVHVAFVCDGTQVTIPSSANKCNEDPSFQRCHIYDTINSQIKYSVENLISFQSVIFILKQLSQGAASNVTHESLIIQLMFYIYWSTQLYFKQLLHHCLLTWGSQGAAKLWCCKSLGYWGYHNFQKCYHCFKISLFQKKSLFSWNIWSASWL